MVFGYHRVSTKEQRLDRGITEIEEYCAEHNLPLERIYTDKMTGTSFQRPRYTVLKEDILRQGDTLILTELDRLGRGKKEILQELQYMKSYGIRVMVLEIPTTLQDYSGLDNNIAQMLIDTINNLLIELYATMAQAELEKRAKRQREGIEAMKRRGEWQRYGRPRIPRPSNWDEIISQWKKGEITAVSAAEQMHLSKTTFYNMVRAEKEGK